ncbi:hypothetical protein MMC34_000603 [Xylographa carneopallida]|nr:hypothetical protein [Xylographa carneopallida]
MFFSTVATVLAAVAPVVLACDNCYGPRDDAVHVRNVRRMQPGALNATTGPRAPLEWGQLNIIHTTDTHGWLEGHIKEQNYGADWGDFSSFVTHMQHMAGNLAVDLLVIDTGDLHDGNGDSDAEYPDGSLSNPIFENVAYDVLTIGNHELYLASVAELTFTQFSQHYGAKYLTSNVQILNNATGQFQYIGQQSRYFTTAHGLRIMAFGILYDFTGNTNVTKVIKAKALVQEAWFLSAIAPTAQPVDLFLVLGHNPARPTASGSTFATIFNAIRAKNPSTPIQFFGGHSHIRDFAVLDEGATSLESGRYCETLGWFSMSGINSSTYTGVANPRGVPNPTQPAIKVSGTTASAGVPSPTGAFSKLVYSRRYIDWNRLSFAYHAVGSQSSTFDLHSGLRVSSDITTLRTQLNLTALYGCAPQSYCQTCAPFGSAANIFPLIETALGLTVVNASRATVPRLIIVNTGGIRFDLIEGPFTYDDSFIVSPFTDGFQYIPNVPYSQASQVLAALNGNGGADKKRRRELQTRDFGFAALSGQDCIDDVYGAVGGAPSLARRAAPLTRGKHRRQTTALTPGYTTSDDFGTTGDDTIHSAIPYFPQPDYIQANASFPPSGVLPAAVDLVFLDFFASDVVPILNGLGASYTLADVTYYLDPALFTTQTYLPLYAQQAWQANVPNCPVGNGFSTR